MKTILLADDEENLRTLVRTTLDQPGYRILESADGASALALARAERPDVVVLDWMMPSMNGLDEVEGVLPRVRANAGSTFYLTLPGAEAGLDTMAETVAGRA